MIKVGITGNIGAGKSYIGDLLLKLGAYVYPMDDHIKFLEDIDPWLIENIEHHFGKDIYTDKGLNRKNLLTSSSTMIKRMYLLFDALLYKKGFVAPKDFIRQFENIDTPRLIYSGLYSSEIVTEIRENVLKLNEGAVFKGVRKTKGQDIVWMVKVKTNEWLLKVKEKLSQEGLIKELNGDMNLVNSL